MRIRHESVNGNWWRCLHEQSPIVHTVLENFQTIAQLQFAKREMSNDGVKSNCYKIWHMFEFGEAVSPKRCRDKNGKTDGNAFWTIALS